MSPERRIKPRINDEPSRLHVSPRARSDGPRSRSFRIDAVSGVITHTAPGEAPASDTLASRVPSGDHERYPLAICSFASIVSGAFAASRWPGAPVDVMNLT